MSSFSFTFFCKTRFSWLRISLTMSSYYSVSQSRPSAYQAPFGARSASAHSYERAPLNRSGSQTNVYSRASSTDPGSCTNYFYNTACGYEVWEITFSLRLSPSKSFNTTIFSCRGEISLFNSSHLRIIIM